MPRKKRQRYFLADGTEVPGVTTILSVINKPALVRWANQMGLDGIDTTRHVDDLAQVGTLAHSLIQEHLTGGKADLRDFTPDQLTRAETAVRAYHSWEEGRVLETEKAEVPMVSEALQYGGTPDWFGKLDGRWVLLDFKTSRGIYDDHVFQLAAYWNLLVEQDFQVDEARILRVGRKPEEGFEERIVSIESLPMYFEVFKAALKLRNAIKMVPK